MRLEKLEDKIEQVFAEQLAIYNSMKLWNHMKHQKLSCLQY
jgi:hypothetical protein